MDKSIIVWYRWCDSYSIDARKMSSLPLVVATRNRGKLIELRELLRELPWKLCDLNLFPSIQNVEETGKTFVENASLKATGYAQQTQTMTLADDSGLEVEALGGAPGVRSARYGGENASDNERVDRLLSQLANVKGPDRRARFVSAIAIANAAGIILNISTGACEGRIADSARGTRGFGYDPVFIPEGFDKTFGELPAEIKNRISHRARALERATDFLRSLTTS